MQEIQQVIFFKTIVGLTLIIRSILGGNSPQSTIQVGSGCPTPSLTLNGTPVSARQNANPNYTTLTEVKFTAQIPLMTKKYTDRFCKIKCIAGAWVGPLCQGLLKEDNTRFHPILRNCDLNLNGTNLVLMYENSQFKEWNGWLPDQSKIALRCDKDPGIFKFHGYSSLKCVNGEWDHELPICVSTTLMTGFSENSPPTIRIKLAFGNSALDYEKNEIVIYPGSIVHLECLFFRKFGDIKWTWTTEQHQHLTGWAMAADERERVYRMSLYYVKPEDSGNYTCITPRQESNTVSLKIKAVQCGERNHHQIKYLIFQTQGYNIGQKIIYSCPYGFLLKGMNQSSCMANGKWSSDVPHCQQINCPTLEIKDERLIPSATDNTYESIIKFQCRRGFALEGANEIHCKVDGRWSSPVPTCADVLCAPPIIPSHGHLIEETNRGNYYAGTIVQFACDEKFKLVGDETIVCEEKGIWSSMSPQCKYVGIGDQK